MYELKIKKGAYWYDLEMGSDLPAFNYQVNNIGELKDRQANYTQALKLPKSPHNTYTLEACGLVDSGQVITYTNIECRLFNDDSVLAGIGSIMRIIRVNDFYEIQILSGIADFFEKLTNSNVSVLDLGSYVLGSKSMGADIYRTSEMTIGWSVTDEAFTKDAAHTLPFASMQNAINKMIDYHGYTLVHNLDEVALDSQTPAINNVVMNVCSHFKRADSFSVLNGRGNIPWIGDDVTAIFYMDFSVLSTGGDTLSFFSRNTEGVYFSSIRYQAKEVGILNINTVSSVSNSTGGTLKIARIDDGGVVTEVIFQGIIGNSNRNDLISVAENEKIEITLIKSLGGNTVLPNIFTVNVYTTFDNIGDSLTKYGKLYLSENIGYTAQIDLFKVFTQIFGLTILVDNVNQVVYAYTIKKLYDNIPYAIDWSDKLHDIEDELSFTVGSYAQSNVIKFDDNTTEVLTDKGTFTIADDTLQKTKDLFAIKAEAGRNVTVAEVGDYGNPARVISFDADGKFTNPKNRILRVWKWVGGSGANFIYHANAQSLVDTYYSDLSTKLLSNAKYVEAYFRLKDTDIESYNTADNAFIPVWIEKYGAYFYINKIVNYQTNKLTKVELIKL